MERWLPVVGFGLYEVSDRGCVRSLARRTTRLLRPFPDKDGYLLVTLYREGKMKQRRVHQLVLEAFVGPCPEGMQTLHGDGVCHNNELTNLAWGTSAENSADRRKHGRGPNETRNPKAKLTPDDICHIRADGRLQREIAAEFGIDQTTVSSVKLGRTWAGVGA